MSPRDGRGGAQAAPAPGGSVIHDLGYRHYDGPRLDRRAVTNALLAESARGAYGLGRSARAKVVPLLLLAAVTLPAVVLGIVTGVLGVGALPADYTSYVLDVQVLVAVFVAAQAPALVSRDLRFSVVPLYFSRPLHRVDYVVAKYAALATAVFVLTALPLTVLLAGALLAELPVSEQLPGYLRGLGGALLLSVLVAGIGLVLAAVTPRRGLGVAAIIAVLALAAGVQAFLQEVALELGRTELAGWVGLLSPFTLAHGVQDAVLGAESALPAGPPGPLGALVFTLVAVLVPALCFGALLLRYRKVAVS